VRKLFVSIFFFLFLFSGVVHSKGKDKYKQSDKARERYMKKVERKNKRQQDAFLRRQFKGEIRKGKHGSSPSKT